MSTTIDQRVVEMRFDNKHFEQNVRGTMSTLDKLKQKLNLKGAAKGLENINTSANKVNMSGMTTAIETAHSKFSALEVMGVTALANITNSAVNAGKRIAKALTIEPITTGLSEYETQINAVQTILANTQKEGTNVERVNAALDELNKYADNTIYNFTEMTRNIGTFTAAGVKLDDSVSAIKGIANLAAVSGSTSQQASTAMYQLSQALAAGKVQLMDWNSVVNAGMGGQVFQDALKRTAKVMGTDVDAMIKKYGSFRESLTKGEWLTADVLTKTLEQFTMAAEEGSEAWNNYKKSLMSQGYTEAQAVEILKLANTAQDAATKVKTFTQLWDVMKEAAQSGWSQTWRLIIGDFEQAKNLFSPLAEFFTGKNGIITVMSNARNKLLESALGKSFTGLLDKVNTSADGVKKVVDSIKDYGKVVDEIIGGKWGNGQSRWDKLTEAGYDWAHAQNLVNEKLGNGLRRATNYKEAQNGVAKSQEKTTEKTAEYLASLAKLSDAELEAALGGKEQAKAFRELQKAAEKTGIPLKEFIENIDQIDGRYLLLNSFKNLGASLVSVFKSIGTAWKNAFPPMTGDQLFNIIAGLHKFSTIIRSKVEANADKLTRTLKGLFAVIDMIAMVVGGGFRIAFTILKTVLGVFNIDILEFTARIGDALVAMRDWIEENNIFVKGIRKVAEYIKIAVTAIKDWIANNETIAKGIDKLKSKLKGLTAGLDKWFDGLKEAENVPKYILQGLVNGIKNGASFVIDAFITLGKGILEAIKGVLGIHSPSREFFEIGKNIIQGLINGIKGGASALWGFLKEVGSKCVEIFKKIDFGKILAVGVGLGMLLVVKKMIDVIDKITDVASMALAPLQGFGNLLTGLGNAAEDWAKGSKIKKQGEAIKDMAIAIGILAASIYVLSKIKPGTLWATIGAIAALAGVIVLLAFAASKMNEIGDFGKSSLSFVAMTASLFILAKTLTKLAKIDPNKMNNVIKGFAAMIIGLSLLMFMFGVFVKGEAAKNIDKAGIMIAKIAGSLMMMAFSMQMIAKLKVGDIIKSVGVIASIMLLYKALIAMSNLSGEHADKAGKMISKMAWALLISVGVIKLASMLKGDEIIKGMAVITMLGVFFGALVAVSHFAGQNALKAGGMMLMMSIALGVTVGVIKLIGTLGIDNIIKAMPVLTMLGIFFAGLVAVSHFAGQHALKAGGMLLMISGALLILTGVLFLLGKMNGKELYKALGIVVVLELMFMGLIQASQFATECVKSVITIGIVVGLLIGAVALLTLIDSTKLLSTVAGVSILLLSLSAVLYTAGTMGPMAKQGIVAIALLGLVVAEMALILGVMSYFDVNPSIQTAVALSTLLIAMSASLVILGAVGAMGPAAFIGIGALAALIAGMGVIITAIGALFDKMPMLEQFLDKGVVILGKIGEALGSFVGNIVGGFLGGVSNGLPTIGSNLTKFMENVKGFIDGAKTVDESVIKGVGYLAGAIIALSAADLINGITSFLSGGDSFAQLGSELSSFMTNASGFLAGAKNIDPAIMEGVKTLADAILVLTGANIVQGIGSWFAGDSSLADFGSELSGLGTGLNQFATNLGTFDDSKVKTVNCASKAIKTLADAASEIPNEGGWAAKICGENSLATFGSKLPELATHINGFITNLGTFDDSRLNTVKCAGKAIKALADAASEIPNQGGLWAVICGDNSLATFGSNLPSLGTNLSGFITNLGSFDDSKITTVNCACTAIKSLASAAKTIPNEGGLWAAIVGDNSLATLGGQLPKLGKNIASFVANLGNFTEAQVVTVNSACKAIRAIAKLGEIDINDTGDGLNAFGKNMVKFAKKVKEFVAEIGEVGSKGIDSAIKKTKELVEMAKTVASTNIESLDTFGKSLKKVAKDGVKGFVKEFSGDSPKSEAKKAVKAMLDAAIEGAESKKSDVKKKFKSIAEAAVDALCTDALKKDAKSAGKDLVTGFANGIKNNKKLASDAGSSIGKVALKAAKEAIDSNSPSKEAMYIGNYFGEGFVIGIKDYASKTYDAAYGVADRAKEGLTKAISTVTNILNSDMDTQPTIRPVLDLSEVEDGASYLNTMFNNGPSVGVMANLNAISSGLKSKLQNGANDDVVYAINKLRKDMGNVHGDTYNINGVSVDDDSSVTDAVKTIIRAATQERRV